MAALALGTQNWIQWLAEKNPFAEMECELVRLKMLPFCSPDELTRSLYSIRDNCSQRRRYLLRLLPFVWLHWFVLTYIVMMFAFHDNWAVYSFIIGYMYGKVNNEIMHLTSVVYVGFVCLLRKCCWESQT